MLFGFHSFLFGAILLKPWHELIYCQVVDFMVLERDHGGVLDSLQSLCWRSSVFDGFVSSCLIGRCLLCKVPRWFDEECNFPQSVRFFFQ